MKEVKMHKSRESAAVAEYIGDIIQSDEERAAFERDVAKIVAHAELLNAFDDIRAGEEISKAELARRIGVKPSVVSKLLNGKGRNVQLDTIVDLADGLDLYVEVKIRRQPKRRAAQHRPIEIAVAA
jgi:DNA-binding Xre family transcriptional regulator